MDDMSIERCRRGDQAALTRLVMEYGDAVYQTAYAVLGDAQEAQDASQETWLIVLRKLDAYRANVSFRGWLLTIAAHEAYNRRRVLWRATRLFRRQQHLATEPASRDNEWTLDIMAELRRLPREQATAVILRYYHDLSISDIALVMDRPEGTIKSWLSRSLKRLRAELSASPSLNERLHNV